MRGIVTLAAALALPTDFPFRDLILASAFGVTLGTLVVQGLTLRPLMLRLGLEDDGSVEREIRLARIETLRAGLAAAEQWPGAEAADVVRQRLALQLRRAEEPMASSGAGGNGGAGSAEPEDADSAVIREAMAAQRQRLLALRSDSTIGDAAFQRIEEELDRTELDWSHLK